MLGLKLIHIGKRGLWWIRNCTLSRRLKLGISHSYPRKYQDITFNNFMEIQFMPSLPLLFNSHFPTQHATKVDLTLDYNSVFWNRVQAFREFCGLVNVASEFPTICEWRNWYKLPADTLRNNDTVVTSKRRYYYVVCSVGTFPCLST